MKPLYVRTFDPIFVLSKSNPRKLTLQKGISSNDCWNMLKICKPQSNYKTDKLIHPTQKPLELFSRIIVENSDEGDLVLDPFAGVFTTGKASLELKRNCIGIEINKHFYCDGIRRIKC
jgi:DNA modification methylase